MHIDKIYRRYKIMPNLQEHMFRVASVAKLIADNMKVEVDTEDIVRAMLLHDMGNILKFKLSRYPKLLEPEGLLYWEGVKDGYWKKFGDDEHKATQEIAKEIGVSERVYELVCAVGFSKSKENRNTTDMSKKICCYADQRVAIDGVTDLQSRLAEGRKRYLENKGITESTGFEEGVSNLVAIQDQIFKKCKIKPKDIGDKEVGKVIQSGYLESLEF